MTLLRYGKKLQHLDLAVRLSVSFTEVGRWNSGAESSARPTDGDYSSNCGAMSLPAIYTSSRPPMRVWRFLLGDFRGLASSRARFRAAFTREGDLSARGSLVSKIEAGIGLKKESWPIPLLRALSDVLLELAAGGS